jgi:hypothetical protein
MAASIGAAVLAGLECGRRERSARSGASPLDRLSHL